MGAESTIEGMLYAVRSYFESNINTYLDAIDAAKKDRFGLEHFKLVAVSEKSALTIAPLPAVLLRPMETGVRVLTMGSDEVTVQVMHTIVIGGGSEDELLIKSMRYADAVRELYTADTTCGGGVDGIAASAGEDWLALDFFDQIPGATPRKVVGCGIRFVAEVAR